MSRIAIREDGQRLEVRRMRFQGAHLEEQGVEFAVVVVKPHVVQSRLEAGRAQLAFQPVFPGLPIVLMTQDSSGTPTYFGRPDLADFLARVPLDAIPWQEFETR